MATQQIINTGSSPNNRTGDPLRVAFAKVNDNFANLEVLDANITLTPVDLGSQPNDSAGNILRAAFQLVNTNFSNLSTFYANLEVVNIGMNPDDTEGDTLRMAFTKINNNFSNLFPLTGEVEIITSTNEPPTNVIYSYSTSDYFSVIGEQEIVNIGAAPNDGTGDPLRTAFSKINNNFANLFATSTLPSTANTTGNTAGQIIFSTAIANFYQAQFSVRSTDSNANSQSVTISAQLNDANSQVKFNVYGGTFFGDAVCTYNMDVNSSNVRILVDPLINSNLTHTIFTQLMQQQ